MMEALHKKEEPHPTHWSKWSECDMSEGKKERKKRRLPFATGIKGYHCLDYYNGRTVRVVLYDQFGTPIPQSDTRYTRKNGESERDGFRFAPKA